VDKVDQAKWLERLANVAINAKVKTVLGSVLASSDTAADEAVLNNVHKKKNSKQIPLFES
jgi:hypothetical protein